MARGREVVLNSCDVSNGSHSTTSNKWTDSMESVHVRGEGGRERDVREREGGRGKERLKLHVDYTLYLYKRATCTLFDSMASVHHTLA